MSGPVTAKPDHGQSESSAVLRPANGVSLNPPEPADRCALSPVNTEVGHPQCVVVETAVRRQRLVVENDDIEYLTFGGDDGDPVRNHRGDEKSAVGSDVQPIGSLTLWQLTAPDERRGRIRAGRDG
jgi:hypothetical protein